MGKPIIINFPIALSDGIATNQALPENNLPSPIYLRPYMPDGGGDPIADSNLNTAIYSPLRLTRAGQGTTISFINTSSTNYSSVNIIIYGIDCNGNAINETLAGPLGASTVTSSKTYQIVNTITTSGAIGGNTAQVYVKFNHHDLPALKFPGYQRPITAFTAEDLSGNFITFIGTDLSGNVLMESIAGPNATTGSTTNEFASVILVSITPLSADSFIELGTGPSGTLMPIKMDNARAVYNTVIQIAITSNVSYTVYQTADTLETTVAGAGQSVNTNANWTVVTGLNSQIDNAFVNSTIPATAYQCLIATESPGSLTMTVIQQGLT